MERVDVVEIPQKYGRHRCDNCLKTFATEELITEIRSLSERIEAGGVVPSGECPACGALCYPISEILREDGLHLTEETPEPTKPAPAPEHCRTCEDSRCVPHPEYHNIPYNIPCPDCMVLTPERRAWYLRHSSECPFCFSADIEGGSIEVDAGACWQRCDCHDCGRSWDDIYTLTGVELPR